MFEYRSIFKYKDVYVMPKKISIIPQAKNTVSSEKKIILGYTLMYEDK